MQSIPTDEIKLTDLVRGFKKYSWHVLKWSWVLVLFCVLFGWLGYWFAKKSPWAPPDYVANASFNAVDAKSSAGGLMALAGSFGVGAGGWGGGVGRTNPRSLGARGNIALGTQPFTLFPCARTINMHRSSVRMGFP